MPAVYSLSIGGMLQNLAIMGILGLILPLGSQMSKEEKILGSWKEIADYLGGKDVTTVIRWEKDRGLPVHRIPGGKRPRVFAYADEIDAWLRGKQTVTGCLDSTSPEAVAKTGPSSQSAAVLSREMTSALDTEAKPERDRVAMNAGIRSAMSRHGRHRAAWVGLAFCLISLFIYMRRPSFKPQVFGFTQLTNDGRKKAMGQPLFTDGEHVYFWEDRGAGMVLASVSVEGGEVTRVTLPPGFRATDISKDGSEFIGSNSGTTGTKSLAMLSTSGKSIHWLMEPPVPDSPTPWIWGGSWSPSGNRVAFAVRNDVFEAKSNGTSIREVAHLDGWPNWPRWSPDGELLSFSVLQPKAEKYRLWEVNADGTRLHPLRFMRDGFTETCCGDWTPDGKVFIFVAEQGGHHDIWAVREKSRWVLPTEQKPVRLTSGPLNYHCPLPSRDGKDIFVLGDVSRGELMRFDLKSRSFVDFLGGISAAEVNFSRDGKWISYVTYPDYTLWRARSDGSDALQLTFPPLEAREPRWSPDGQEIAFQGVSSGARYKICIVPSDGGKVREAISTGGEEGVATWLPDGCSLIYDEPLYRHAVSQMFIHRLDLKSGKTYKLPGSAGTWTARLSPDGRYIATLDATPTADPHDLIIFETKTDRRYLVMTMRDHLSEPTWSRDGKYVYFATLGSSAPALYRIRVRDKKLERLTSLEGFPVAGLWTGVAPDGSPLLLRDISTEELYALHVRLP